MTVLEGLPHQCPQTDPPPSPDCPVLKMKEVLKKRLSAAPVIPAFASPVAQEIAGFVHRLLARSPLEDCLVCRQT
ncbi:hypothetical protein A3I45_01720 [Candidatus Uhrbacteria bacterium RIFCSPLOWO2_02_FULL_53_10]|uniref:Uncharacterized protein n=1 Tax=Candidatus Uhrbacteria bacterium RIFCSPLOWO2_02_FULL_53_10 TaxID=1802411 RepID=A0A1F7VHN9_9BACT|nr:MAG: hypothetical protein A3I45_01720 [Candidatus Uhrbacteria bacterium RIFCSPLOWO2_02_FULL_53_10]